MKIRKIKLRKRYKVLLVAILFITTFIVYARLIEPNLLEVKEYDVTNNNLPSNFKGVKVIHISDIHYGRTIKDKQLTKIVKEINLIKPDIVIFTGDLIDRDVKLTTKIANKIANELKGINATLGKYAVSGNHDRLFSSYADILEKSDFTLLDNNYEFIYNKGYEPIFIGGINTNTDFNLDTIMEPVNNDKKQTNNKDLIPTANYKIMIMHMPDYIDQITEKYNVDLVLAGHSHNGQVRLPFIGAITTPKGAKKYYAPYYKMNNTDFYISSGLGCSVASLRTFDRPSFNYYILNKSK
jgi:predicted MPP superfamily phosphohydrolase